MLAERTMRLVGGAAVWPGATGMRPPSTAGKPEERWRVQVEGSVQLPVPIFRL